MNTISANSLRLTPLDVLAVARGLRTDDDSNPEYDRALVELTVRLLGMSHDEQETIAALILGDRS